MIQSILNCLQVQGWCLAVIVGFFVLSEYDCAASDDAISVWAAGSTEKIQDQQRATLRHDGVWDAESKTVRLEAVRGEYVPFQVVISTSRRHLNGIQLLPSSFFSDKSELSADRIKLYLVQQVNVYTATQDHGSAGRWPDALVPLVEPFDMRFYWYSQKVNFQSIWIDVKIPEDQAPGTYRGSIAVSFEEGDLNQIAVEIMVHDLKLPRERNFPVHIGLYENHIARVHGVDQGSEAFNKIFEAYLNHLFDHRCDPRTSPGFQGMVEGEGYTLNPTRPDLEKLFLNKGRLQYWISPVPNGVQRPSTIPFPDSYVHIARQHIQQVIDHSKKMGWYAKLGFHVPVDEPNSAEDYAAVREWGKLIKSVDGILPVSVTEQPKPESNDWGLLSEHVDAWIINGNYLFTDRASIDERRRAGDQVLWYISCDQGFPQPNLYIDREAADPRMIPWISWVYQMSGFLYWNATYWWEVRNPWLDPVTWKTLPCNLPAAGEGSLFYPGNLTRQFSGQPNVEGPIGSMRLALLREGLEERELLLMLEENIGREALEKMILPICSNIREFSRNPNQIDQIRHRLIKELLAQQKRQLKKH